MWKLIVIDGRELRMDTAFCDERRVGATTQAPSNRPCGRNSGRFAKPLSG